MLGFGHGRVGKRRRIVRLVAFWCAFAVCAGSVGYIAHYVLASAHSAGANRQLASLYSAPAQSESSEASSDAAQRYPAGMLSNFYPLFERNRDICGWITIPGTVVNYPVVQTDDDSTYLTKAFDGTPDSHGTIFMDSRDTLQPQSANLILYGHEMQDGQMFHAIRSYSQLDFYQKAPVISFNSIYKNMQWKVFAAFLVNTEPGRGYVFPYLQTGFASAGAFDRYIREARARSFLNIPVDVQDGDALLTLSTCSYEFDGARFVVLARLLRSGESTQTGDASPNRAQLDPAQPMS